MATTAAPASTPDLDAIREHAFSSDWWREQAAEFFKDFTRWMVDSGLQVLLIAVLFLVTLRISRAFVRRSVQIAVRPRGQDALKDLMIAKRQKTLMNLFDAATTITLSAIAFLMVLQALGLSVGPLLASAGVAGVAIGFGAQTLVKDILSGAFIIMEQQFSVGDVIQAAGVSGGVEEINLRTVVLRDGDGSVHIIPNGKIDQVTVLTRDWSRLVLDLDIGYGADIDEASAILKQALESYAAAHPEIVLEPPEVLGVQSLAESSVQIRGWMKVIPGKQWAAGRELRAAIKKAFDSAGIEIPFPQRTVWLKQESSS